MQVHGNNNTAANSGRDTHIGGMTPSDALIEVIRAYGQNTPNQITSTVRWYTCAMIIIIVAIIGLSWYALYIKLEKFEERLTVMHKEMIQVNDRHRSLVQYINEDKDTAILTKRKRGQVRSGPVRPGQAE